jgi:hypothetical protein
VHHVVLLHVQGLKWASSGWEETDRGQTYYEISDLVGVIGILDGCPSNEILHYIWRHIKSMIKDRRGRNSCSVTVRSIPSLWLGVIGRVLIISIMGKLAFGSSFVEEITRAWRTPIICAKYYSRHKSRALTSKHRISTLGSHLEVRTLQTSLHGPESEDGSMKSRMSVENARSSKAVRLKEADSTEEEHLRIWRSNNRHGSPSQVVSLRTNLNVLRLTVLRKWLRTLLVRSSLRKRCASWV